MDYFFIPREELNEEQIILYNTYSEFMIYFPDIGNNSREGGKIEGLRYYQQFFFSQLAINHFIDTIPNNINGSDRTKMKYCSSKCLRGLLSSGIGENFVKLFEFIDFTKTIILLHLYIFV